MAAPKTTLRVGAVTRLKSMLPAEGYLHLLHQGAMTGFLPRFTPDGQPSGQFDNLAPKDRVEIARYLLDKVLPDAPKELALVTAAPTIDAVRPEELGQLSTEELRALTAPVHDEVLDVQSSLDTAPALQAVPCEAGAGPA